MGVVMRIMFASNVSLEDQAAFRMAAENGIMDGIADARRANPEAIPPNAEAIAVASLRITHSNKD